jgi:hypothetical protein
LIGGTFFVSKYKEDDVSNSTFRSSGVLAFNFNSEFLDLTYSDFKEASFNTCTGQVRFTYEILTKSQFDAIIQSDEEVEESSSDYDIFTPYLDNTELLIEDDEDDDTLKPEIYYVEASFVEDNLEVNCPIPHQDTVYFYFKLYPLGDLDIYNYNRKVFYEARSK